MFPINLDNNKYCSHKHSTLFIRSALKGKPYENTACVFLIWTILQMKMSRGLPLWKKHSLQANIFRCS